MGFIYNMQAQNQPYPHANPSLLSYLLFVFTLRASSLFRIDDVLNKNKNRPNEPIATVFKNYI